MSTAEPTVISLKNPLIRYLLATRPPFLLASLVPCLLGISTAHHDGIAIHVGLALTTIVGALLIHAGVNVLNDYYDSLNGTDAINQERLYPFTGGSRFIQNGLFTPKQTASYGVTLLAVGGLLGIGLSFVSGFGLWVVGAAGIFLGWAYSAPPVCLNHRGLGELSVAMGFGILIPIGADYVQRGVFSWAPVFAGLPYALLVANLLFINQFPDRRADAAAGKRHWVVRLGPERARWGYALIGVLAYAVLVIEVMQRKLPTAALWALLPALLSAVAAYQLVRHVHRLARLRPAIAFTIAAMIAYGSVLAGALMVV